MPLYNVFIDLSVVDEKIFESEIKNLSLSLSNLFTDKSASEYESYLRQSKQKKK